MEDISSYFGWHEISHYASNEDIEYCEKLFASIPDAIKFILEHSRNARWDIVGQAINLLTQKYQEKENDQTPINMASDNS